MYSCMTRHRAHQLHAHLWQHPQATCQGCPDRSRIHGSEIGRLALFSKARHPRHTKHSVEANREECKFAGHRGEFEADLLLAPNARGLVQLGLAVAQPALDAAQEAVLLLVVLLLRALLGLVRLPARTVTGQQENSEPSNTFLLGQSIFLAGKGHIALHILRCKHVAYCRRLPPKHAHPDRYCGPVISACQKLTSKLPKHPPRRASRKERVLSCIHAASRE